MHVSTLHEAELHVQHVKDWSSKDLTLSSELVMMKRVMGTEHSVDVVLFEGQLVAAFVTDKGPTHFPLCWQTTNVMPSLLSEGRGSMHCGCVCWCCSCCRCCRLICMLQF